MCERTHQEAQNGTATRQLADDGHDYHAGGQQPHRLHQRMLIDRDLWQGQVLQALLSQDGHLQGQAAFSVVVMHRSTDHTVVLQWSVFKGNGAYGASWL